MADAMNSTKLPQTLNYEGKRYCLNIERMGHEGVALTYEHDPIVEDSFLIACCGKDIDTATKKMRELLNEIR